MSLIEQELVAMGVDLDLVRQGEDGCVVNTLSSITGELPTDIEWFERAKQVAQARQEWRETFRRAIDNRERLDLVETFSAAYGRDCDHIEELVRKVSGLDTPMGKALDRLVMTKMHLTMEQLRERIAEGNKIMLSLESARFPYKLHAAHVGIDDKGKLLSLSDGGTLILEFDEEADMVVGFVFKRK